jgi:hypothetical protein
MTLRKILFRSIALLSLGLFLLPLRAYGYIDLGSGSYIIQLVIAGFVGLTFSLKIYWKKIKARLFKKKEVPKSPDAE